MAITREQLEARRAEFLQQLEQVKAQSAALSGALQTIEILLADDAKATTDPLVAPQES